MVFINLMDIMAIISVMTDLKVFGEIVYGILKSSIDIEQSYDTFKDAIHADRTYMKDDFYLQGTIFVNFIALKIHYRIFSMLEKIDLHSHYLQEDVAMHSVRIHMLGIGDQ